MKNTQVFLKTETDKKGIGIDIFRVDNINMTPVLPFFLRALAELMDNNHGYPSLDPEDLENCGAIYAESNGKVLGHIVFNRKYISKEGYLWIQLSAVDPDCRGRGIYTILHKYFEDHAKELGCWAIASHVRVTNETRLISAEKVGMKPIFYFMGKKLS